MNKPESEQRKTSGHTSIYIIQLLISRLQQIRKQGVPWWLLYCPRYPLSFAQIFENIMKHGRKWWDPNFQSFKSHTLAGNQSNCTTIQYYLLMHKFKLIHTTQSQTIADDRNWHQLGLTPLYLTHYTPSICAVCICRKNQYGALFFFPWKDRYHYIKNKRQKSHFHEVILWCRVVLRRSSQKCASVEIVVK